MLKTEGENYVKGNFFLCKTFIFILNFFYLLFVSCLLNLFKLPFTFFFCSFFYPDLEIFSCSFFIIMSFMRLNELALDFFLYFFIYINGIVVEFYVYILIHAFCNSVKCIFLSHSVIFFNRLCLLVSALGNDD